MPAPYYVYWGPVHASGQHWAGPFEDLEIAKDYLFAKADEIGDTAEELTEPTQEDDSHDDKSDDDNSDDGNSDDTSSTISEAPSVGVYFDPTNGKDDGNVYVISSFDPQKEIKTSLDSEDHFDSDDDEDEEKDDLVIRKILAWELNGPDLANYWFPQIDLFPAKKDEPYRKEEYDKSGGRI